MMLARTGIGLLVLADFDTVEPSNLNRQCYGISHLGMQKTEACANQIREINPLVQVQTYSHRITAITPFPASGPAISSVKPSTIPAQKRS